MLIDALLVLLKVAAVEVVPEMEIRYGVMPGTTRVDGTTKVTRRVVPNTVAIVAAATVTTGPPPVTAGSSLTVTSAAEIVPVGKPDPVRVTLVEPGVAAAGEAVGVRFTCARRT
jgi:hypothetical protein